MLRIFMATLFVSCRNTEKTIPPIVEEGIESQDADGDGFTSEDDCDDNNPLIYPNANEVCDGLDNNCNNEVDEGVTATFYLDSDQDGFGDSENIMEQCGIPTGYSNNGLDCDDSNDTVYPSSNEICDGLDNDCDEDIDEGLFLVYYLDVDLDGYGDEAFPVELCQPTEGYSSSIGDCNDADPTINPDSEEVCDGFDNDCDGFTDEDVLLTFYADNDGDGFGDSGTSIDACAQPVDFVVNDQDCNDSLGTVNPIAMEICDGIDNDCDLLADEAGASGEFTYYTDSDGDGFGDDASETVGCIVPTDAVLQGGDCDDLQAESNPASIEVCDGIDNNCDTVVDESGAAGELIYYTDSDGDGFGDDASETVGCIVPTDAVLQGGDCDDQEPMNNPGLVEICDGIDNDCDLVADEAGAFGEYTYYIDLDGDGFGDDSTGSESCVLPADAVLQGGDCDDIQAASNPASLEICDGIDNNCDTVIDEPGAAGELTYYSDSDADGFGDILFPGTGCTVPTGFALQGGDCDDQEPLYNPAQSEVCDLADNDCDGFIDENATDASDWYLDFDVDGYGDPNELEVDCDQPNGYVDNDDDCDDDNPQVSPVAIEIFDGLDNNCDSLIDEGTEFGDGSDGDLDVTVETDLTTHISSGRSYADAINYSVVAINGDVMTLDSTPLGIESGDEIIVINLQGSSSSHASVGEYEFLRVDSVIGDDLTVMTSLVNIYGENTNLDLTDQQIMIQRVPQYLDVYLSSTLTTSSFDGSQGGVLAFRATGTVELNGGTLSVDGLGYRGGATGSGSGCDSYQGESYAGLGAGDGDGSCSAYNEYTGQWAPNFGGGGAHITAGGGNYAGGATAGDSWDGGAATPPEAGIDYGVANLTSIFFGSGGGGVWNGTPGDPGPGGDGAGIIYVAAQNIISVSASTITSRGEDTFHWALGSWIYGSGGGAGGSIFLVANNLDLAPDSIDVGGGAGMTPPTGYRDYIRIGGDGGYGRILLDYDQLNGSVYPNTIEELSVTTY